LRVSLFVLLFACFATTASAESQCRVMDPTGTQLNVRTSPNGKIIDTLPHRILVAVVDETLDLKHRTWVFIKRGTDDEPIGWVYRDYISCQ
jgi:hypothetical protein